MEIRNNLSSIAEKFDNDLSSLRKAIIFLTAENSSINELQVYLNEYEKEKDSYRRQLEYLSRLNENEKKTLCVLGRFKRLNGLDLSNDVPQEWISEKIEEEIMRTLYRIEQI